MEWGRGNILQLQCGGRTGTSVRLGPCVRWLLTVVSLGGVRMRSGQAGTVDSVDTRDTDQFHWAQVRRCEVSSGRHAARTVDTRPTHTT